VYLPTLTSPLNYQIVTEYEEANIVYRVRYGPGGIQCACVVRWDYLRRTINSPSGTSPFVGLPSDVTVTQSSDTTPGAAPLPVPSVPPDSPVTVTHLPCSEWSYTTFGERTYDVDIGTDARSTITDTGYYSDVFVGPVGPANPSTGPTLLTSNPCNPLFDDCTTQGALLSGQRRSGGCAGCPDDGGLVGIHTP
jgi:hypothetical protein